MPLTTPISLPGMPPITVSASLPPDALASLSSEAAGEGLVAAADGLVSSVHAAFDARDPVWQAAKFSRLFHSAGAMQYFGQIARKTVS